MRRIKTYEAFNEVSSGAKSEGHLKEVCEDLFQDLKDSGFTIDIDVKIYPEISYDKSYINVRISKVRRVEDVERDWDFRKKSLEGAFQFNDIRDVALQADPYLRSLGFKSSGHGGTENEYLRNPLNFAVERVKTTASLWWRPLTWKLNEELRSEVYSSAAGELKKKGHLRRAGELEKWAEEMRIREKEQKTLENFEEAKFFSEPIKVKVMDFVGTFYPKIAWNVDEFRYTWTDWLNSDARLWLLFDLGFIPADEETHNFMESIKSRDVEPWFGIWYLGNLWLHLNDSIDEQESEQYNQLIKNDGEIRINPEPKASVDANWFGFHIADRKSARRFKDFLVNVFSSKDVYSPTDKFPGGMIDQLNEELCERRPVSLADFLKFLSGIKNLNLNQLYRD